MFDDVKAKALLRMHAQWKQNFDKDMERFNQNVEAFQLLVECGLEKPEQVESYFLTSGKYYNVEAKDLSKYRKVLGKFSSPYRYLNEKGDVRVEVSPLKYPGLKFAYTGRLTKDSKCEIVERAVIHKELVCKIG